MRDGQAATLLVGLAIVVAAFFGMLWFIMRRDPISEGVRAHVREGMKMQVGPRRNSTRRPTHPGAILREDVLPALGLTPEQAAEAMGVDPEIVRWILAETASVTPELAEAINKLAGNGPNLWLRMQEAHDRAKEVT